MNKAIPTLTGVRGVAALWVVFYHMQDAANLEPRLRFLKGVSLLSEGFRGVDLFFVLSGFILFYVHHSDFVTVTWTRTRYYAAARYWRVYPLNAAVLLMIIALSITLPAFIDPTGFTIPAIIQSLLLAQRWFIPDFGSINPPSWSLSVEIIGYAAFPLLAFGLNRIRLPHMYLFMAGLCLLALVAMSYKFGFATRNITGRLTIIRMFPAFIAGAALGGLFMSSAGWISRHAAALATASVLAALAMCSVPVLPSLTIFPIAVLVLALAYERGQVSRFMASGPIVWLGRISFSLYLTHFTVLNLILWVTAGGKESLLLDGVYTVGVLAAIIAISALVHYGAERPLTQISRGFSRVRAVSKPPISVTSPH